MSGRLSIALLALTLLAACASPAERHLAKSGRALAPPHTAGDRVFEQLITIRHEDKERTLVAAGQICDGALTLALLSPEGLEVLRLRHDGEGVDTRVRRELPEWLPTEAILADLQLVYWPAEALTAAWGPQWSLREDARGRTLLQDGEALLRVSHATGADPWEAPVTLEHLQFGYTLGIRTLHHEDASNGRSPCEPDRAT